MASGLVTIRPWRQARLLFQYGVGFDYYSSMASGSGALVRADQLRAVSTPEWMSEWVSEWVTHLHIGVPETSMFLRFAYSEVQKWLQLTILYISSFIAYCVRRRRTHSISIIFSRGIYDVPRLSIAMPCHFRVWTPSWTGWLAWHKWSRSHVNYLFGRRELVGNNNGALRAKSANVKGLVFIPNMEKLLLWDL